MLREQIGHPLGAVAPRLFELVENLSQPVHSGEVGVHQLFSPATLLRDQARPFQHRDVLLYRRKADRVSLGQTRNRRVCVRAAAKDVPASRVRERVEQLV
jgi:hypothetical protein